MQILKMKFVHCLMNTLFRLTPEFIEQTIQLKIFKRKKTLKERKGKFFLNGQEILKC